MPEDQWAKVGAVLEEALARPRGEREAFLQEAIGDAAVRAEVASLLEKADQAVDYFDRLATATPSAVQELQETREPGARIDEDPLGLEGTRIGRYEALEHLGGGGMGVVYKARDAQLDRSVALKFLPPHLAASTEANERFIREAKAASALDHPNIATVYEIGETEPDPEDRSGWRFIAMAYYAGETLKKKIARGPLPVEEASEYAIQIAEGLQRAHEAGIIHRDVKPANVIVTERGEVKLLDFGLAKRGDASVTRAGQALGTVAYMSPEQTRGEEVDAQTDLWALGAVLYEMLTGERPFNGAHPQAAIHAIRNDDPTPMDEPSGEVPAALQAIVGRCLKKDPAERYQTAEEVRTDLQKVQQAMGTSKETSALPRQPARPRRSTWTRRVAIGLAGTVALLLALWAFVPVRQALVKQLGDTAPSDEIRSLAVLPLVDLSKEAGQEYLAAGMTEALTHRLGRIGTLTVISRTSVLQYRGSKTPVRQMARELGVDAVVEGSVLRAGQKIRITARLVEAPTGRQLWAGRYAEEFRDVLALQSEVARAVATEIQVALTSDQENRLARSRPVNPETYKAYLRGTYHLTRGRLDQGLEHLRQAVDEDPADPLAWAGLATGYVNIGHSPASTPEAFQRAKAAATRALELDETIAEAHAALGDVKLYYDWDWDGAEQAFRQAIALNPNLAEAHRHYAWLHLVLGREDEAIATMKRAQTVSPLAPVYTAELGWLYWTMGRYDEAIDAARTSLDLHPDYPPGLLVLGGAQAETGRFEEAIAALEQAGPFKWARTELARTYARMGQAENARRILAEFDNADPANAPLLARIHAALGEKDRALQWLEAGYASRNRNMPWIAVAPAFTSLHGEPRFQALLEKVGADG